ncbi:MAG: hypothetical protein ACTSVG_03825 [Alphaproteobacteria bacterium]
MVKDLLSPEDVASIFSHPIVVAYWPLLVAAPLVFLALSKRVYWVAIPLACLALLVQAWRLGMLA